jgi:hypothetical protein
MSFSDTSPLSWANRPDVAAVIPTTGRPSLQAAVRSVLEQTEPVSQLIVAVDGPVELVGGLNDDSRVEVVSASGYGRGGNAARVAGIDCARAGLVALLDDDDAWYPRKIEVQLRRYLAAQTPVRQHVVVACRVREVGVDGKTRDVVPQHMLKPDQRIADYLFERTSVRRAGGILSSSMLLFDRALVEEVPFDRSLPRHQDWDWLIRVDARSAARFEMVPEVLLDYAVSPPGRSVSSGQGWQESAAWLRRQGQLLTRRQRGEVLLSVTVPIALKHGEWLAASGLLLEGLRLRPSWRSLAFSLAHVPLVLHRRARDKYLNMGWQE